MLSTAIIVFREVLEIAMILSVVLAATKGLVARTRWIAGGFACGIGGAILVACFAGAISEFADGIGQELFNALILFTAAGVIGWTAVWMRTHAREMVADLRHVGMNVTQGTLPRFSLLMIIALAILREGSEIVLFLYGTILSGTSLLLVIQGAVVGLLVGTTTGWLLYRGFLTMSARKMLSITGTLLLFLVAGLTAQAIGFLSAAGYFSELSTPLWNTAWLLSEDSIMGKMLHTLIGYTARPTPIQLLGYVGTLVFLFAMIYVTKKPQKLAVITSLLVIFIFASIPTHAFAIDKIYSPIVVKGEVAAELSGIRTFDANPEKNNIQEHEFELEYGVTSRWKTELTGSYVKEAQTSFKVESLAWENTFQFFEQGENWVDSGVLLAYGNALKKDHADSLEAKLLIQKDWSKFTSKANIGLERDLGVHSEGGIDYSMAFNTRYRYNFYVQPGIEIQSDFGERVSWGQYNHQEHYIGPSIEGHLTPYIRYEGAYLLGASKEAASSAARFLLEYEYYF